MPYKDPNKRKAASKIRSKKWYQEHLEQARERRRQYAREHKEEARIRSYKCDQKRFAPYHAILDNAGVVRICEFCGSTEDLCVHHKDLNHNNNELSNLQWLCRSCHSKLHEKLKREEE